MKGFNTADKATVAAIHRLNAPEMQPLLAFLKSQYEESKTSLIRAEGDMLTRMQGRAGYLQELLDAVSNAASTLEKLR